MRRVNVRGIFYPSTIGEKICVLDGPDLRSLRDGLGLRSPWIIPPEKRQSKPFWNVKRNVLTSICNKDLIAPNDLRSTNLLSILQEKFLEKRVRKLTNFYRNCQGRRRVHSLKNLNVPG